MPTSKEDLKNCFLVAFKAGVHGGLSYRHSDGTLKREGQLEHSSWKTDKVISDKDERGKAVNLAAKIKRELAKLGRPTELGTIIPAENEKELDTLIGNCSDEVSDYNVTAVHTHIRFRALKFFISGENEAALEDMLEELRETLGDLRTAVKSANLKNIREVVARLKGFDAVLPESAADYLQRAVADARKQARTVRKAIEKKGMDLEDVQKEMNTTCVDFARFAVMDPGDTLEEVDNPLVKEMLVAHNEVRGAGVILGAPEVDKEDDFSDPFPGEEYARQVLIG